MALRLASTGTKRITIADDEWIDVRADISRRAFNTLVSILPAEVGQDGYDVTIAVVGEFSAALFEAFVTGWSVVDEDGNPVPATEENYELLSRESAQRIDQAIGEHFNSLSPNAEESTKSKKTG
jgi:hypothetical protein